MELINTPGKGLLKVMGIIELIFGGISSIIIFIGFTTADTMNVINPLNFGISYQSYYVWGFLLICYNIIVGIMAVMYCATLEKASLIKTLASIMLVLVIIDGIIAIVLIGLSAIVLIPISIALSSLFIVGAKKNEKEYINRNLNN